ncbi:hypothetical protein N8694_01850 [bacterium]|nr:hypothetical protein [bacterium]
MSEEKKIDGLETPDFRLATDEQRVFEKMEGQNKYQMMKLWFQELVRTSDPSAKFDANVGLTATKFKMGLYQQENKAELVDLILEGEYPSNFLTQVRNLIEDHPEISREAAYLNSLKVFYLTHERWPYIAELNRQVIEDHPEAFPNIRISDNESLSDDERKMFRRIRKKLNIDWLPEGKIGLKN